MGSIGPPGPGNASTSMPATTSLQPTWHGYVGDTREALILFEAAIGGTLNRVVRRPHDRERASLIKSGSIFIYEESASGIKRWTDGVPWSPSRILNNFLIYRELEKPFPPGEKKRAAKKTKKVARPNDVLPDGSPDVDGMASPTTPSFSSPTSGKSDSSERDAERSLVGSLTDSYAFKDGGLVKKTMSVNVEGVHYHLVSYYKPEDVTAQLLPKPMETDLRHVRVRHELVHRQNFRAPLDDNEEAMQTQSQFGPPRNQYMPAPGFMAPHGFVPHAPPPPQIHSPGSPYYASPQNHFQMPPQPHPQQAYMGQVSHGIPISPTSPTSPTGFYAAVPPGRAGPPPQSPYSPYGDQRAVYPPNADHYGGQNLMDGWPPGHA